MHIIIVILDYKEPHVTAIRCENLSPYQKEYPSPVDELNRNVLNQMKTPFPCSLRKTGSRHSLPYQLLDFIP